MSLTHPAGRPPFAACASRPGYAPGHAPGQARAVAVLPFAAALLGLLLLLDAPVWLAALAPVPESALHLAQPGLITHLLWGEGLPVLSLYGSGAGVEPGPAAALVLAGLTRMTGDPRVTDAAFLSLYGLFWIGAAFAASRAETDRPLLPTLLLLPLAYGTAIHRGSYGLALGVPAFLLFAAFWRRLDHRRDVLSLCATALVLLALAQTHAAAVFAACLIPLADGLERMQRAWARYGAVCAARVLTMAGLWASVAALPALLLVASDLVARSDEPGLALDGGYPQIVGRIASATCLFTSSGWEVPALAPLLGAFGFAGIMALRRFDWADRLWPIVLALMLAACAAAIATGEAQIAERLAPFAWGAVVLTIAGRQPGLRYLRAACAAALLGLAGQSAMRVIAYRHGSGITVSRLDAAAPPAGRILAIRAGARSGRGPAG